MRQQQLLEALRTRPFRPFRLHVTDGAAYDVRHPELVLVTRAYALVGSPAVDQPPPAIDKHDLIDLLHVTRLEQLESPSSPSAFP